MTTMTTLALRQLLDKRYEETQGWLLFHEVRNTTGYARKEGYCDAMAMSIWPSRGIALHGFELKQSRSDLVAELRQPKKADEFTPFCDHWWLVVSDKKLVEGVEVPATWGILAPQAGVLRAIRDAPKRERQEWKPTFIASLLRRFYEQHIGKSRNEIKEAAHQLAKEMSETKDATKLKQLESTVKQLSDDNLELKREIREFEQATGLTVRNRWDLPRVGEAVRALMGNNDEVRIDGALRNLKQAQSTGELIAQQAKNAVQAIELFRVVAKEESDGE